MELSYFQTKLYYEALQIFFSELNLPLNPITEAPASPAEILSNTYNANNPTHRLIDDVYVVGMVSDEAFSTQQKKKYQDVQNRYKTKDYEGLLLFGVTLKNGDRRPTRSQLSEITRAFNKEFHYTPVVVIFKYGDFISFANCERMAFKQSWREGEKTGKVSLLKDISFKAPHTGHLKILQTLAIERSGRNAITTFADLYKYWQSVFNVNILNKAFYQELSNWYFWALSEVSFPDDAEKNEEVRNAENTIRLITRLIFVWFLKEKGLVPDDLFDKTEVDKLLDYRKDKTGSAYYRAILQNLFFATLNVPMNEREFRDEKRFQGKNDDYMNHRVYRYAELFKISNNFEKLFGEIPFLNGGLFDCLDYRDEKDKEVRIDCYSDNPKNLARLAVPDKLFFGSDVIDLSEIYDDRRKNAIEVRGIIDILNSYKFTIAENTPVEEEIALDPELLGRVFENLLASYNPETLTTARKQTGSFYTPREIVNYMVDESLKTYLATTLGNDDETKKKLDQILDYGDGLPELTPKQTQQIISALENAKILDPACGSGAFPIGILQKMVHVLEKLDPKNEQWKQALIKRTPVEARKEMEKILAGNTADYIRKLGIIQNCIYGVDIQPIAIQVSKLRFFISLLVDFTVDKTKNEYNYGIQPLPNLDYKLMQGNSLIEDFHGFTLNLKEQDAEAGSGHLFCENSKVIKLIEDLWEKQSEYLRESRPKQKEKLRDEVEKDIIHIFDTYIRQKKAPYFAELKSIIAKCMAIPNENTREEHTKTEIAKLDKRHNFNHFAVERDLKDFTHGIKPRNFFPWQLYFADVFKIKGGFDVVIGNPPWVSLTGKHGIDANRKVADVLVSLYSSNTYMPNLYEIFILKSLQLLKSEGVLSFIVPDRLGHNNNMAYLRRKILCENKLKEIIYRWDFESIIADTMTILVQNTTEQDYLINTKYRPNSDCICVNKSFYLNSEDAAFKSYDTEKTKHLVFKIASKGTRLGDYCKTTSGFGGKSSLITDSKINNKQIPVVKGASISKYKIINKLYFEFNDNNLTGRTRDTNKLGKKQKILLRKTGNSIIAAYDNTGVYPEQSLYFIYDLDKKIDYLYLLGVLNSKLITWYYLNNLVTNIDSTPQLKNYDLDNIPVLLASKQSIISELVSSIIENKLLEKQVDCDKLEAKLNMLVYQLYGVTEDEISLIEKTLQP